MKKQLVLLFSLLVMTAMSVFAADVTGKWVGEAGGRGAPPNFTFKQDGSTLTGSTTGRGGETQISNGKVDGDNISFEVTREMNGNSMTIKYSGSVSGKTMKLTMETARGNREITLTKQE